jgi:4'-phosphopantetheinyl transferase
MPVEQKIVNNPSVAKEENFSIKFSRPIDFPLTAAEFISPQGVDIWLLDLSAITSEQSARLSNLLSRDELERAKQFKKNRHHFIATRALLRQALTRYTSVKPEQLLFSRSLQGKPFLVNSPVPLFFNLSHSCDVAALAVTSLGDVGVDIERMRYRNYLKIVERFFHQDEHEQLLNCNETDRKQLFHRMWTLKEAFFKATGSGISQGLDKVRFHLHDNNITAQFADDLPQGKGPWQFHQAPVAPTTLVAIAVGTETSLVPHWFDGNCLLSGER